MTVIRFFAAIGAAVLLAGCGQRGPLYLPGENDAAAQKQSIPGIPPGIVTKKEKKEEKSAPASTPAEQQ